MATAKFKKTKDGKYEDCWGNLHPVEYVEANDPASIKPEKPKKPEPKRGK